MARNLKEIRNFHSGTFLNASEKDIPEDAASFSLNVDPEAEGGILSAINTDKLFVVTGGRIIMSKLPIPWGYTGVNDADLSTVDAMKLTGINALNSKHLTSLTFIGTKGRLEKISLLKPRPHFEEVWRDNYGKTHPFTPSATIEKSHDSFTFLGIENTISGTVTGVAFSGYDESGIATITVTGTPADGQTFILTTPDGNAVTYEIDTSGSPATGAAISTNNCCIQLNGVSGNEDIATQIKNAIEDGTRGNGDQNSIDQATGVLTLSLRFSSWKEHLPTGTYFSMSSGTYDDSEIMKVLYYDGQTVYVERGCFGTNLTKYLSTTEYNVYVHLATLSSEGQGTTDNFYAQLAEWSDYSGNNIGGGGRHWMIGDSIVNKAKAGMVDTGESGYSATFSEKTVTWTGSANPAFNEGDRVTFYFESTGTDALRANQGFSATILKIVGAVWTLDTSPTADVLNADDNIEIYVESSLIKNCTLSHAQTSSTQTVGANENYKINDWLHRKTGTNNAYANSTDAYISRDTGETPFHFQRNETTDFSGTSDTEELFYPFVNDKPVLEIAANYADTSGNTADIVTIDDNVVLTPSGANTIFAAGNVIKIGTEYMKVLAVDYSSLTVTRGYLGSTIQEHASGVDIYINEVHSIYQTIDKSLLSAGQTYTLYFYATGINNAADAEGFVALTYNGSTFNSSGQWELADTNPLNGYIQDVSLRAYSSSASNITQEKKWIPFRSLITEIGRPGDLTQNWIRYEFQFTLPQGMSVLSDLGIEFTNLGKNAASYGLDQLDLLEYTPMYVESSLGIGSTSILDNKGIKDLLIYNKETKSFSILEDVYNIDNVSINSQEIEKSPFAAGEISTDTITTVRNNRELHIGLGGEGQPNFPQWIGYLNSKLFGKDNSGTIYQDEDTVHSYESGGGALLSKITVAGEHEYLTAAWDNANGWLDITHTNHSMVAGDNIVVREWSDSAGEWEGKGVWAVTSAPDVNTIRCKRYNTLDPNPSNNNFLPATGATRNTNSGKVCYRPHYYYGIRFGDNHIYRITPSHRITGETTLAEDVNNYYAGFIERSAPLSIPFASITTCHSKSDDNGIGGGRVYCLGKDSNTVTVVNIEVAYNKWAETSLNEAPFQMVYKSFLWSNERDDGNISATLGARGSEMIASENCPTITPSGFVSDILETKGPTKDFVHNTEDRDGNDEEHFDTRLWVQFHPGGNSSFRAGSRFLFCGKSLSTNTSSGGVMHMGDRTPATTHLSIQYRFGLGVSAPSWSLGHAGFNFHGRFGWPMIENYGSTTESRKGYYWAGHSMSDGYAFVTEYLLQRHLGNQVGGFTESYNLPSDSDAAYHTPYVNLGQNMGFVGDPSIKVARYGLFPVSDNDRDGVLDGTGVVVPSTTSYHALGYTDADFENPYGHPSQRMTAHAVGLIAGADDKKWLKIAGKMQGLRSEYFQSAYQFINYPLNEAPSATIMEKFAWICSDIHLGDFNDMLETYTYTSVSQSATTVAGTSLIRFTISDSEEELFRLQAGDLVYIVNTAGEDWSAKTRSQVHDFPEPGISAQIVSVDVTNKRITTDLRWEDFGGGSGPSGTNTGNLRPHTPYVPHAGGDHAAHPPGWDTRLGSTPENGRRFYHFCYGEDAMDGTVFTEDSEHTRASFYTKHWLTTTDGWDSFSGSPGMLNCIDKLNFRAGYMMRPFIMESETFEDLVIGNNTTVDIPSFPDHVFHVRNGDKRHYNVNNTGSDMTNGSVNRLFISSPMAGTQGKSNLYAIDLDFMYPSNSTAHPLPYTALYEDTAFNEVVPLNGNSTDWNRHGCETYIEGVLGTDAIISATSTHPNATLSNVLVIGTSGGGSIYKGSSRFFNSNNTYQNYTRNWHIKQGFNKCAGACITVVDNSTGQMQTRFIVASRPSGGNAAATTSSTIYLSVHYPFAKKPQTGDYYFVWSHADVCTAPLRLIKNIEYSSNIPVKSHPSAPYTDALIPMFASNGEDCSSIASDGTTLTVTTSKRHNLTTGDIVQISGTTNMNTTSNITVTAPTIFTIAQTYEVGTSHSTESNVGLWKPVNGNKESSTSNPLLVDIFSPAFKAMYGGLDLRDDRTASVSGVADDSGPQQLTTSANHLMATGDEILYDAGSSDLTGNYSMTEDGANKINIPTTETELNTGTVYKKNFELFAIEKGGDTKLGKIRSSFSRWDFGATFGNVNRVDSNDDNLKYFKSTKALISIEGASASIAGDFFESDRDYKYKVSLIYDGYQEGPLSEGEWTHNEGVTRNLLSITVRIAEASKRLTHVCVYRKDNAFDYYKLVDEIKTDTGWALTSDGLYEKTIMDNGELSASYEARTGMSEVLDTHKVKYGISTTVDGFLFAGDCSHERIANASNMIFRSRPGMFSLFDYVNDTLEIESTPTALANFNGRLYAFDNTNTYRINQQTLYIEDKFVGIGCLNRDSVIVTEFGMFYADKNGAYQHDGSAPRKISSPIHKGGEISTNFGGTDNIKDVSWENVVTKQKDPNVKVCYDANISCVLFIVDYIGLETDGTSKSIQYVWAYHLISNRWDLWELSENSLIGSPFNGDDGDLYIPINNAIFKFRGGSKKRDYTWISKKLSMGEDSSVKVFNRVKLNSLSEDINLGGTKMESSDRLLIATNSGLLSTNDVVYSSKDSGHSQYKLSGSNKKGRWLQFKLENMTESIDSVGVVFRKKSIK